MEFSQIYYPAAEMTESSQPLGPQLYVSGGSKHIRRIVAEDPDWTLAKVPYLSKLCLESVMKNIEGMLHYLFTDVIMTYRAPRRMERLRKVILNNITKQSLQ